jgi:hypothetical protein
LFRRDVFFGIALVMCDVLTKPGDDKNFYLALKNVLSRAETATVEERKLLKFFIHWLRVGRPLAVDLLEGGLFFVFKKIFLKFLL